MGKSKKVVEVKRQSDVGSNQWGIYVNGKLVEGGFFSKEVAEENARKNTVTD